MFAGFGLPAGVADGFDSVAGDGVVCADVDGCADRTDEAGGANEDVADVAGRGITPAVNGAAAVCGFRKGGGVVC